MTRYLDSNARETLEQASHTISTSFDWASSPEGHAFWSKVHLALLNISVGAPAIKHNPAGITLSADQTQASKGAQMIGSLTVHIFDKDQSICGMKGDPAYWPIGNKYVRLKDKRSATCVFCKAKAPL